MLIRLAVHFKEGFRSCQVYFGGQKADIYLLKIRLFREGKERGVILILMIGRCLSLFGLKYQIWGRISITNLFLTILKAGSLRLECQRSQVLRRVFFPVAHCLLLMISSHDREERVEANFLVTV